MTAPLPFAGFLEDLRRRGLAVGVRESELFYRLLARWQGERISELRDAAAALLARNQAEVALIRRVFDDTLVEPPPAPPRPPARRVWPLVLALVAAAALLGGGIVAGVHWWRLRHTGPLRTAVVSPPETPPPGETPSPAGRALPRPPDPPPAVVSGPRLSTARLRSRWTYGLFAGAAGGAFLLLLIRRRREGRRYALRTLLRERMAAVPGPQHFRLEPPPYAGFASADLDDLATWLGRRSARGVAGRKLDIDATVRSSVRRGHPVLVFDARPPAHSLVLLIDVGAEMRPYRRKVAAFVAALEERGVQFDRWYFETHASTISSRPHGEPMPLRKLSGLAEQGALMVVSTGMGVLGEGRAINTWVTGLAAFSSRAWVNPITDEDAWRGAMARVPMPALPLDGAAFGRIASALGAEVPESRLASPASTDAQPPGDGEIDELRQLAALLPSARLELVMWLRETFLPRLHEETALVLARRHQQGGRDLLRWAAGSRIAALHRLRTRHPEREHVVRRRLFELLAKSEPPASSAAHLRWRLARAEQDAFLATPGDLPRVRQELETLAASPIAEEADELLLLLRQATGALGVSAPDGGAGWDLRAGDIRRGARRDRWRAAGIGVGTPRASDVVRAVVMGVAVVGLTAAVRKPPMRVLPNVAHAYALDLSRPALAPAPTFQLRRLDDRASTEAELLKDGHLLGKLSLDRELADPASAGHWYQVVGRMPDGALALSDLLQAPADEEPAATSGLIVSVFEARSGLPLTMSVFLTVDGDPVVKVPLPGAAGAAPGASARVVLDVGSHRIEALLAGYRPFTSTIDIRKGREDRLEIRLEPDGSAVKAIRLALVLPAALQPKDVLVNGTPWDGKPIQTSPGEDLAVEVASPYYDFKKTFKISEGQRRLDIKAKPRYGVLVVSRPAGSLPDYEISPRMQEVLPLRDVKGDPTHVSRTYRGTSGNYELTKKGAVRLVAVEVGRTSVVSTDESVTPPPAAAPVDAGTDGSSNAPILVTLGLPAGLQTRDILVRGTAWDGNPLAAKAGEDLEVEVSNPYYDFRKTFKIAPGQSRIDIVAKPTYGVLVVERSASTPADYKIDPPLQEWERSRDLRGRTGVSRTYRGAKGYYNVTRGDLSRQAELEIGRTILEVFGAGGTPPLKLDLARGLLDELSPALPMDEVKRALPFYTGDTPEGTNYNYGGGVFFGRNDFYFYTYRDAIQVRARFSGTIVPVRIGATPDELRAALALRSPYRLGIGAQLYTMPWGCLEVAVGERGITEMSLHARPCATASPFAESLNRADQSPALRAEPGPSYELGEVVASTPVTDRAVLGQLRAALAKQLGSTGTVVDKGQGELIVDAQLTEMRVVETKRAREHRCSVTLRLKRPDGTLVLMANGSATVQSIGSNVMDASAAALDAAVRRASEQLRIDLPRAPTSKAAAD